MWLYKFGQTCWPQLFTACVLTAALMKRSVSPLCASLHSDCKRAACIYLRCLCWDEFRRSVFDVAPDDSILFRVVAEASGDTGRSVPLMTDMWLTSLSWLSCFPDVVTPVLKTETNKRKKNSDATEHLLIPHPRVTDLMDEQMNILDFWFLGTNKAEMPVNAIQCEILLWYSWKICKEVKQKCLLQYCTVYSRWSHKDTSFLSLCLCLFPVLLTPISRTFSLKLAKKNGVWIIFCRRSGRWVAIVAIKTVHSLTVGAGRPALLLLPVLNSYSNKLDCQRRSDSKTEGRVIDRCNQATISQCKYYFKKKTVCKYKSCSCRCIAGMFILQLNTFPTLRTVQRLHVKQQTLQHLYKWCLRAS